MRQVSIRRLRPGDAEAVVAAGSLFDRQPTAAGATTTLEAAGHHLLVAYLDSAPVGFVTGVETSHPDKGTEMLVYELGVDEGFRRQGIGRALVSALRELAAERGCYGMWVAVEPGNEAAVATYRSAGAGSPEAALIQTWALDVHDTLRT
ncbi:MAG: GNAT family N-acetyltransferase [Actinomycetota bacterium]|nr:GNAT family N-acetyltransferase [Actinomycetota bacterium]